MGARQGALSTPQPPLQLKARLPLLLWAPSHAGPMRQLKKMFEKTRIVAALMFLLFMVLTLLSAIWLKSALLTIAFCLCQYCALVWYGLSYIPYGRTAAKKAMNTVADAI